MGSKQGGLRKPTLAYKLSFLAGGAAFAATTYFLGALVYDAEDYFFSPGLSSRIDLAGTFSQVFQEHLLTFVPWVAGTTAMFIALGYLFDKQVRFRRMAEELRARAEALAVTDGLTLVFNHCYILDQLALELKRTKRYSRTFALLFLDVDDFKGFNDTHGHQAGDDVLRQVALVARATARETDLVARYGGEEFMVIAVGTDKQQATILAERIRERVERKTPITVSVGVSGYPNDGGTVEDLIRAADRAMYEAKDSGKNRVCVAPDSTCPPGLAARGEAS